MQTWEVARSLKETGMRTARCVGKTGQWLILKIYEKHDYIFCWFTMCISITDGLDLDGFFHSLKDMIEYSSFFPRAFALGEVIPVV